jgi:hypothetical protein
MSTRLETRRIRTSSFAKLNSHPGLSAEDLSLIKQDPSIETTNKIKAKYPNNPRAQGQISILSSATK